MKAKTSILANIILATILLTFISFVFMPGVQAKATRTPFTGRETFAPVGDPERAWVDDDGIQHVRGFPILGTFDGDLFSWSNDVVFGFNLDLATGDGNGFGTCDFDVTWGEDSGTFEGRFIAKIIGGVGGVFTVDFSGHGSGDFEGMKIMGTGTGSMTGPGTGWLEHEGIILNAHG